MRVGGGCSVPRSGHLPPGKTRYPLYRKLDGLQGRSGKEENFVPTGIRMDCINMVKIDTSRELLRMEDNNKFICFSQTQKCFTIDLTGY